MSENKKYIPIKEFAAQRKVSHSTLYSLIRRHEIDFVKEGNVNYIWENAILDLKQRGRKKAKKEIII